MNNWPLGYLSPVLFLLYVNDLPDAVQNSSVACFADDTKIFRCVNSISDAALLQSDLTKLNSWSTSSRLAFNQLKFKCLRVTRKTHPIIYEYTIKNKEISTTTMEKDLGILVAADLTWTNHIQGRCAIANKLLGLVRRSIANCTTFFWLPKSDIVSAVHSSRQANRACPKKSFEVHAQSFFLV